MKTVYLAGPIAGTTEGEAKRWRIDAAKYLCQYGIIGISPLRNEPAKNGGYATAENFAKDHTNLESRAIAAKNWFDVKNCDMILVYLPYIPGRASYGTVWEIGAGYALGKDIVLVSNDPAIINHPDIALSAGWIYENLYEGLSTVVQILGPYA